MFRTYVTKIRGLGVSGKEIRLRRIFKEKGRTVIVAMDHGQFSGPIEGISYMKKALHDIVEGRPDGIILNPGILEKHGTILSPSISPIVRITGASTNYSPTFSYHPLTTSVEFALKLGADAVIAMGFIGGEGETNSLKILGEIAEKCYIYGIPLIAEMLPQDPNHFKDPKYIALGARVAYELGADVIKIYYTQEDSFKEIVDSVSVPIVVAGGPKDKDAFSVAKEAIKCGAKGVAFGRNVFQAEDPIAYIKKLKEIVYHESSDI